MPVKDILAAAEQKMKKSLESLQHELATIRTGKASTAILDGVKVDAYGQLSPLKQVANVTILDNKTLSIQVWDRSLMSHVDKAIRDANLGLNPVTEGQVMRIPIPPLTEERRKDYVKMVKKQAEESKVAVRNIRRDSIQTIEKEEKDKKISEDDKARGKKDADGLTHKYEKLIDESVQKKEKELMEV